MKSAQSTIQSKNTNCIRATAVFILQLCFVMNFIVFTFLSFAQKVQLPQLAMNGIYAVFIINLLIAIIAFVVWIKNK